MRRKTMRLRTGSIVKILVFLKSFRTSYSCSGMVCHDVGRERQQVMEGRPRVIGDSPMALEAGT